MPKADLSHKLGQKRVSGQLNQVIRNLLARGTIEYTMLARIADFPCCERNKGRACHALCPRGLVQRVAKPFVKTQTDSGAPAAVRV